jgi:hypothetical protein
MVTKKNASTKPAVEPKYIPRLIDTGQQEEGCEDDHEPRDQECYKFNDRLPASSNNKKCRHCKKYLTTNCDRINDFIDEDGDVDEG